MKKILLFVSTLLSVSNAFAAKIPLITMTAEAEPGKTAYIGIYTNSENEISKVYYIDSDKDEWSYTLSQLATYKTLVYKKGYELVKLKATNALTKSAILTFRFLKSAITSEASTKTVALKYNSSLNQYQLLDSNKRPVTRGHVSTRRNLVGVAVGIEDIQLYQ